jgi:hypothetical protein
LWRHEVFAATDAECRGVLCARHAKKDATELDSGPHRRTLKTEQFPREKAKKVRSKNPTTNLVFICEFASIKGCVYSQSRKNSGGVIDRPPSPVGDNGDGNCQKAGIHHRVHRHQSVLTAQTTFNSSGQESSEPCSSAARQDDVFHGRCQKI